MSRPLVTRKATVSPWDRDDDCDGIALVISGGGGGEPGFAMVDGNHPSYVPHLYRQGPAGWELTPESSGILCRVCGVLDAGGGDGSDLRVGPSSLMVSTPVPGGIFAPSTMPDFSILSRVRSAVTMTAHWIEFAIPGEADGFPPLAVSLVDLEGIGLPPPGPLPALASTVIYPAPVTYTLGRWRASEVFDPVPAAVLHANRDYGLQIDTQHLWTLGTGHVTGTPDLGFMRRTTPSGPWVEDPSSALALRVIGVPVGASVGVPIPIAEHAAFGLRLGPNPSGDDVSLAWSGGGAGRARIDILDVRGRMVRRVRDAGAAAAGQWRWDGRDERGEGVAPGVYYLRVSGAGGRVAVRQVVRIR